MPGGSSGGGILRGTGDALHNSAARIPVAISLALVGLAILIYAASQGYLAELVAKVLK